MPVNSYGPAKSSSISYAGEDMPQYTTEKCESPLASETNQLDKAVAELEEALNILEQRMQPVLRPIPPQPGMEKALQPEEMLSPHADLIRSIRRRVTSFSAWAHEIMNRLEV